MVRTFQILAVVLAGIAAYFLWSGNKDAMFVSFVLSACCVFLTVRFQAKARLIERETLKKDIEGTDD